MLKTRITSNYGGARGLAEVLIKTFLKDSLNVLTKKIENSEWTPIEITILHLGPGSRLFSFPNSDIHYDRSSLKDSYIEILNYFFKKHKWEVEFEEKYPEILIRLTPSKKSKIPVTTSKLISGFFR